MLSKIKIGDTEYELVHVFDRQGAIYRAIIRYDGLLVLVDKADDGSWALTMDPPSEEEKAILKGLIEDSGTLDTTVVTVTKDE